ncbi:MAG TPA: NifB/NifX family molybdenum-iron cluster-binding protein [Candidatus Goldiibacteriota bacterium]|nr:NifB/NifX family molybdenum-iron cluster-binding protein [Candidatus Goldiibacteriota bacterium]HPN65556.1 NifB/NifX family molybdenum-iron cluster-binding protein [Candidatus Goldiibacteriota bacterium]HRQ45244.1 NifB/NifX family molybdenum-iron cluster-binding protein [Candidatus Goldiibacteriota bacterium]
MKICVPSGSKKGLEAEVYGHFGSAPYFTLIDTESGETEIIENSHSQHEHGACNPAGTIEGKGVKAVVCAGMGARAVQKLNDAGIKVFSGNFSRVSECVDAFKRGEIAEMSINGSCRGHDCGHHED